MARIKHANVRFLSLCRKGKNGIKTLYKSEGVEEIRTKSILLKAAVEDKGELTAIVYAPEAPDKDGDYASADAIRGMAHSFMQNGAALDLTHDEQQLSPEQAYVAESFIVQKGDERFGDVTDYNGNKVDVTGAWAVVVQVEDRDLRKAYASAEWEGVSLGGEGLLIEESTPTQVQKAEVANALAKRKKESGMDAAEVAKVVGEALAPIVEQVADLKKALEVKPETKEEIKKADAPEFDPSDIKQVAARMEALAKAELLKSVDFDDLESVKEYHAQLAALSKAADEPEKGPAPSHQGDKKDPEAEDAITYGGLLKADEAGSKAEVAELLKLLPAAK